MSKRFAWSTPIACFALLIACSFAGEVMITKGAAKLRIDVDGQIFDDYDFQGSSRPFLFPIIGPGGTKMTRSWPIVDGVPDEAKDHPHHKSFWWGHGDMNGIDFWAETTKNAGKVVHEEFTAVESGEVGVIK